MRTSGLDFDEYFVEQWPKLVSELDFILGSTDLARDVAQDAFIRQYVSWARLSRYDKPGAWVRKVALRIAFRARKNAFRSTSIEAAEQLAAEPIDVDRATDVREAIKLLSPSQRTAIVLHYYRDLPVSEVASAMGCKESTAKAHLFQARKRLAQTLAAYAPPK